MSGPYRTPQSPGDEDAQTEKPSAGLGTRRSSHTRAIAGGALAAMTGGWVHVDILERGLAFRAVDDHELHEVPFHEIDAVHYDCDGLLPGPPRVVLVTFDGVRTAIPSDLGDLDVVLEAIDREVTRPITQHAKEALARGETLTFGPLVLELDGIVLKGATLSWASLARVVAERDSIVFHAHGPRGRFGWVRLVDIPHPQALLEVLRMRTRVAIEGLRLRAGD